MGKNQNDDNALPKKAGKDILVSSAMGHERTLGDTTREVRSWG